MSAFGRTLTLAVIVAGVGAACSGTSNEARDEAATVTVAPAATATTVSTTTQPPATTIAATTVPPTTVPPTTAAPTTTVATTVPPTFITTTTTSTVPAPEVNITFASIEGTDPTREPLLTRGIELVARLVGELTPNETTIVHSTDVDALMAEYRRRGGGSTAADSLRPSSGGAYVNGTIFMNTGGLAMNEMLQGGVAHEFFHAVQMNLPGWHDLTGRPFWLIEGTATLVERKFGGSGVWFTLDEYEVTFPGMKALESQTAMMSREASNYTAAAALIDEYTETVGLTEDAYLVDLWAAIGEQNGDWRAAWQQVYGADVDEFYAWADQRMS